MITKLYLKKCVFRNLISYINITIIIIASVMMVNILNIYRDSLIYGDKQTRISLSKGYDIWITNADKDDLKYFQGIVGIELTCEDHIIFVKIFDKEQAPQIYIKINEIIEENHLDMITKLYTEILSNSSVPMDQISLFFILTVIFMIIGALSIYFIYTIFIDTKKKDLGILKSLGARDAQILKILTTELLVIYIISFLIAVIISHIMMYFIITLFLSVKNENIINVVYSYSWQSLIILILTSLLSLTAAFLVSSKKILGIAPVDTINSIAATTDFNRNIKIENKSSAVKYISGANTRRNKKLFAVCAVLSVPVIAISLVFLNYSNLLNISQNEYDFSIYVNYDRIYDHTDEIKSKSKELENISGIDVSYSIYNNNNLIRIDSEKLNFTPYTYLDGYGYGRTAINVISQKSLEKFRGTASGNIDSYTDEYAVLISKKSPGLKYSEGDHIYLLLNKGHDDHDHGKKISEDDVFELTVAGIIDTIPQNNHFFEIYVTEENFERITGNPAVPNIINIKLQNSVDSESIKEQVYNLFDNTVLYHLTDIMEMRQASDSFSQGLVFMVLSLCAILFVCVIILLWAFTSSYILSQKQQIDILYMLGAAKKTIKAIYLREAVIKGTCHAAAGVLIGTLISLLVNESAGYGLLVNVYFIMIYIGVIAVTEAAHIMPAIFTVRSIIESEGK